MKKRLLKTYLIGLIVLPAILFAGGIVGTEIIDNSGSDTPQTVKIIFDEKLLDCQGAECQIPASLSIVFTG